MESLDNIVSGASAQPEINSVGVTEQNPPAPESVSDEKPEKLVEAQAGEEAQKPEKDEVDAEEPVEKAEQQKQSIPLKTYKQERKKRQELERQLASLQGQISAYSQLVKNPQQQQQQQPQQNPEEAFYQNPVNFMDQKLWNERLQVSEALMREQHPQDYDDIIEAFAEATRSDPSLIERMRKAPLPAQFAYNAGKNFIEFKSVGTVEELRAKIRAEEKEKLEAEFKKQSAVANAGKLQPSNAAARGGGALVQPQWQGPTALKDIVQIGRKL